MKKLLFALLCPLVSLDAVQAEDTDIFSIPFAELSKVEITSVSKHEEQAATAAAAVYVITQEDIRRSGATAIPQLLRMVPGLHVARYDANTWVVSSRGFNALFANKLLVLIDGISAYSPLHSGVYWDQVDVPLGEIERIEVIRGPGATVWGANAVNGVINIISKRVKDSLGTRMRLGAGNEEQVFGEFRHGLSVGEDAGLRVYAKGFIRDDSQQETGGKSFDDWQAAQSGFRYEQSLSPQDQLTLHGDLQYGDIEEQASLAQFVAPYLASRKKKSDYRGANVLARWERALENDAAFQMQAYFNQSVRSVLLSEESSESSDFELQHRFGLGESQYVTWGLGFRYFQDAVDSGAGIAKPIFQPRSQSHDLTSGFVQDEISLLPDKLKLTLGTKLEHNIYTGFEAQPSARVAYTPGEQQTAWAAYSRALRTPSRVDTSVVFDTAVVPNQDGGLSSITAQGDPSVEAEVLHAFEVGYRATPAENLSLDLATFFNHYKNLRGSRLSPQAAQVSTVPVPHLQIPLLLTNTDSGDVYGGEAMITWQAADWWRLQGSYSYLKMDVLDAISSRGAQQQFVLRSLMSLGGDFELDPTLRYVDSIAELGVSAYCELDLRLGYHVAPGITFSLVGQNLLHDQHQEFSTPEITSTRAEIERGVYAMIDWQF